MFPADIISFWREAGPKRWFAKDEDFDAEIRARFETAHHAAARGELDHWIGSPEGALALVILLDQFPRNLYRGSAHAFATDPLARAAARAAVELGHDHKLDPEMRSFLYLPFEHSEDVADQDFGVGLFEALAKETGKPSDAAWAYGHRAIVAEYGRFPHRNRCLGRETRPEEQAFLDGGGFSG